MSQIGLPVGWVLANYADVYLSASNGTGGSQNKEGVGIPVSRIETIANETIDYSRIGYLDEYEESKVEKHKLNFGDILFSHINSPIHLGKTAIYDGLQPLYHGINLLRIVVDREVVLPEFFDAHCRYIRALGLFSLNAQHAVNQSSLNQKKLGSFELPLPPLAEQQIIMDKLDSLLAQVESIKARLERIPEILKQFRQSVLAAAVSGKLTEAWRVAKGITIETWKYEAAKNVCEKVQSGSTPRENPFDQDGTVPFLKVYNIVDQKIDFDYKPQFITSETHSKGSSARSVAFPNDVLMNIVGPPLGKVAILTNQFPEWNLNQAITLFRVKKELLDHKYLYYVLCEGALVRDVMPETKGSVGQVNISLSQCREAILPVPSIEEQREVVLSTFA